MLINKTVLVSLVILLTSCSTSYVPKSEAFSVSKSHVINSVTDACGITNDGNVNMPKMNNINAEWYLQQGNAHFRSIGHVA